MSGPDLVIHGVVAVTVDAERRVLDDAWISVTADRISGIGTGSPPAGRQRLGGRDFIALPGLIDAHGHAGHGLVRAAGDGNGDLWFDICEAIYARASTPGFWRAEARLTQLERLQSGVTTAVSLLGGGGDVMRTDSAEFGDVHAGATLESGLRTIMAVGPGRRPFPKRYARPAANGRFAESEVDFAAQMAVCAELIGRWGDVIGRRTGTALSLPVYTAAHLAADGAGIRAMSEAVADLRDRTGVLLTQDGHRSGSVAVAADLCLLGPWAVLAHAVDLTGEDIAALLRTGANVAHNPSAIMSILGRCPVPELIDAGITVCLGSDASAPDRGYDMFRHMAQAMHYHRRHFRDAAILPEGKVLEMCTIDAARALGLDRDIGSLEVGKKADIVLVNARRAHLYPPVMPVLRLTHFANAADVDTVIVDGRVLMQGRVHPHLDEGEILDEAAAEAGAAFSRAGFGPAHRREGTDIWRVSRRDSQPFGPSGDDD